MDLRSIIKALIASRTATAASTSDTFGNFSAVQRTAPADRHAWRALKRLKGARRARLQKKAERRAVREQGL